MLNYIIRIGNRTLAIYVLQSVILETLIAGIFPDIQSSGYIFNLLILPVMTIFVLTICDFIITFLGRSRTLSYILNIPSVSHAIVKD